MRRQTYSLNQFAAYFSYTQYINLSDLKIGVGMLLVIKSVWKNLIMEAAEKLINKLIQSKYCLFAGILGVIFLCNIPVLTNPPYWDEITGLHNQALYLAKSNFDFASLYVSSQEYMKGGSLVYPLGILPLVYGVLYWMLPPLTVHVIGHLINMVAIAFAGTMFIRLVSRLVSNRMAIVWGLAALSEPILTSRMAAMGQEAVLGALIMLSIYLFFSDRIWGAIIVAIISCFIKVTGVLLIFALIVYFVYLLSVKRGREWRSYLKYLLVSGLSSGVILILNFSITPMQEDSCGILNLGLELIWMHTRDYYPWITLKLVAGIIGFLVIFSKQKTIFIEDHKYILLPIFILGYFAAYYLSPAPQVARYTAIIVLPLTLMLAFVLRKYRETGVVITALVLFGIQMVNQHGLLLPAMNNMNYPDLERSREYLRAIEIDRQLSRTLEDQLPDIKLICKIPYPQILTMPELRYVTKPLPNIHAYGIVPQYCSVKTAKVADLNGNAILLYAANCVDGLIWPVFIPSGECMVYYIDWVAPQTPGLVIFSDPNFVVTKVRPQ